MCFLKCYDIIILVILCLCVFHVKKSANVNDPGKDENADDGICEEEQEVQNQNLSTNLNENVASNETQEKTKTSDIFFENKYMQVKAVNESKITPKPRRSIHKIVGGRAITEPDVVDKIHNYIKQSNKSKATKNECSNQKIPIKRNIHKKDSKKNKNSKVPKLDDTSKPGPSGMKKFMYEDSSQSDIDDDEKCCVCKKFQPEELRNCVSLVLTSWGQCQFEKCNHWTHLGYCCDVTVLCRHDTFYCPCHGVACKHIEE